jgi:DNA-binding response OmpR family regulator
MYKLLLIDDDADALKVTAQSFAKQGFAVATAESAARGIQIVQAKQPDCILLDVMMPGTDGLSAFRKLREITSAPILFLTGMAAEDDKIKGLMMGADDYIVKPYNFRELEARVTAAIMRTKPATAGHISLPPIEIDTTSHHVTLSGQDLSLTPREYELLLLFVNTQNEVITYEKIGISLWGTYRKEDRSAVMVCVSRLRKKLEDDPIAANLIETVWSKGYKFIYN